MEQPVKHKLLAQIRILLREHVQRKSEPPLPPRRQYNSALHDQLRIVNRLINSREKAMSWYYYLEGKLSFPFRATCTASKMTSPLRNGEDVEVLRMAPDEACTTDMLVMVRWQGRKLAVPLVQLTAIAPDESTEEAIGNWQYWVAFRHLRITAETSRWCRGQR